MVNENKKGFTFLEIGIVLVVIAMVLGGIVVTRDMIKGARVKGIISQTAKMQSTLNAFREKYNGLPGDIVNATTIWGADTNCPNTAANTTKKTATCDGNGDGMFNGTRIAEGFRAIQQLSNANMINGTYTGVTKTDNFIATTVETNTMKVEGKVGMLLANPESTTLTARPGMFTADYDPLSNIMILGTDFTTSPYLYNIGTFLTGRELFELDKKIDDGKPAYGSIQTWADLTLFPSCISSTTASSAVYVQTAVISGSQENCSFYMWLRF